MDLRKEIIKLALKNPVKFIKSVNIKNIKIFISAIKNETPDTILKNTKQHITKNDKSIKMMGNNKEKSKFKKLIKYITKTNYTNIIEENIFDSHFFINSVKKNEIDNSFDKYSQSELWEYAISINSNNISPLFTVLYYEDQVNKKFKSNIEAIIHYLKSGWKEEANPHPLFSTRFYLEEYQDVKKAKVNPLLHYIKYGKKERRKPHLLFDPNYYYSTYKDIENSNFDALSHYVQYGYRENRNPNSLFISAYIRQKYHVPFSEDPLQEYIEGNQYDIVKTSKYFNGELFQERNIHLIKWDKSITQLENFFANEANIELIASKYFNPSKFKNNSVVAKVNPLLQFLMSGQTNASFCYLSPEMTSQIENAVKIEPKIIRHHKNMNDLMQYSLPPDYSNELVMLKSIAPILEKPFDFIFLLSTLRRGGAEIFTIKIIHSILNNTSSNILLICTDAVSVQAKEWLPKSDSVTFIDFQSVCKEADKITRQKILTHIVSAVKPKSVFNCNSWVGWDIYKDFGKSLKNYTNLDCALFCYDYDLNFKKCGYPVDYLHDCIHNLNYIVTDNQRFKDELTIDFGLSTSQQNKVKILHQPPDYSLHPIDQKVLIKNIENNFFNKSPIVIWANRMVKQKRPDILIEIANKTPEVQFHVYGSGNLKEFLPKDIKIMPKNIKVVGPFKELKDINYFNCCAYLHTTSWDGLPTMLLDMLNIGLPVIAPDIGGISNLITNESGWLVASTDNILEYVDAIDEIITKPSAVSKKLSGAKKRISDIHGISIFEKSLQTKLEYIQK